MSEELGGLGTSAGKLSGCGTPWPGSATNSELGSVSTCANKCGGNKSEEVNKSEMMFLLAEPWSHG